MPSRDLVNKPLVEAIMEIRWEMTAQPITVSVPPAPVLSLQTDPHYRLLLARFSERIKNDYQFPISLPAAQFPDAMVPYIVQHQFRRLQDQWPLLQIGPGVMTLNDTSGYTWTNFHERCEKAVNELFAARPGPDTFRIQDVVLRYINSEPFDFSTGNILDFLKNKMKLTFDLPSNFFVGNNIKKNPSEFNWQTSFLNENPKGTISLRFSSGKKNEQSALVWETLVHVSKPNLPQMPTQFHQLLENMHIITDDWFFKLIEGDLERKYSNG